MSLLKTVAILSIFFPYDSNVKCHTITSDDDYRLLPPIFHIDPYQECRQQQNLFCRASLKLNPINANQPSKAWKLIQEARKSREFYRHDQLQHSLCIHNSTGFNNDTILKTHISTLYAKKYENQGLITTVEDVNCDRFEPHPRLIDYIFLIAVVAYLSLIMFATFYDVWIDQNRRNSTLIWIFSLRHNFALIRKHYQQPPYGTMESIQGLRFYLTVVVITGHITAAYGCQCLANTEYVEELHENMLLLGLRTLSLFYVQGFFVISAWLLSYQTFKNFNSSVPTNFWKYIIRKLLNRYLRFFPLVLFIVGLFSTVWIYYGLDGPTMLPHLLFQLCQDGWWVTLSFFGNYSDHYHMCTPWTWYMHADFQLQALSLVVLMLVLKLKKKPIPILIICLLVSILFNALSLYIHDIGMIYYLVPENLKYEKFLSLEVFVFHTSVYSNIATYILSIMFGYIYYRFENKKLYTNKLQVIIWWSLVIGIPVAVATIPAYQYSRITTAILAATIKPLFAFCFAILIFGLEKGLGGYLRKACEWKPIVYLGSLSCSTYLIHFVTVATATKITSGPVFISHGILLMAFFKTVVLSFCLGFLLHLILEMPMLQLQSYLMPRQVHLKKDKDC